MSVLLVGLDVTPDANVVQPGILPLIITVLLGVVIYLLYRSMKRQVKKIDVPYADEVDGGGKVARRTAAPSSVEPKTGDVRDIDLR